MEHPRTNQTGWLEASGLLHIFRTLRIAVQPAKLAIALLAIAATFLLGSVLDLIWTARVGVGLDAIDQFIAARELDVAYQEPKGDFGIFHVWYEHERQSIQGLMTACIPGVSFSAGTPVGNYFESHSHIKPLRHISRMCYGKWWLIRHHTLFAFSFFAGFLIIWAMAGGAICRLAAVQFARDEKQTFMGALRFAGEKLWGGFVLAPCIPLGFVIFFVILLIFAGLVLRIPWLGDLIVGPLFFLPIIAGFIVTVLVWGLFFGGSLLWPSVAAEGSDAFDTFQRSLSYVSRIWKAVLYAAVMIIYASISWAIVNLGVYFALAITRAAVSFGTMPFGWWPRTTDPERMSKMQALWPLDGSNALHTWPAWDKLSGLEYFSTFCIGCWVTLVIALMWSFLASFYFSGSTVIYFLLRRDVDFTDLNDVYIEDESTEQPLPSSEPPRTSLA